MENHRALRDSCSTCAVFMRLSRIRLTTRRQGEKSSRTRDGFASAIDRRIISRFLSRVYNPPWRVCNPRWHHKHGGTRYEPEEAGNWVLTRVADCRCNCVTSNCTPSWPYHPPEKRDFNGRVRGRITPHRRPRPRGSVFRSICHANAHATHDKATRDSRDSSLRNNIDSLARMLNQLGSYFHIKFVICYY